LRALRLLGLPELDASAAGWTLGSVLKYREDREAAQVSGLDRVVGG